MAGGFFSGASDLAVSGGVQEAQDFANDAEQAEANAAASAELAQDWATGGDLTTPGSGDTPGTENNSKYFSEQAAASATAAANSAANVTVTYTSVERYFGDTATIQHMSDPSDGIGVIDFAIVNNSVGSTQLANGAVGSSQLAANGVGAAALNVAGNGTAGQYLASDGDGTFSWVNSSGTISDGGTLTVSLSSTSATTGSTPVAITVTINYHPQPASETISNPTLTVHNSADNTSSDVTLTGTGNMRTGTFTPATGTARTYTFNAGADFNLNGTLYHHTGKATFTVAAAPAADPILYSFLSATAPSNSNALTDFVNEGTFTGSNTIRDTFTANNTSRELYYISESDLLIEGNIGQASTTKLTDITIDSDDYNVYRVDDFDDSQNTATFVFDVTEA